MQELRKPQERNVLISGAGVGGPALAYWLRHHGFEPTVVERAPEPRPGGQAIDIRGKALDVAERMGILAEARELRTRMRGMSIVGPDGEELMRSTERTYSSGRLDNDDIEIFRSDLARLLYDHTADGTEYVFGDSIASMEQTGDGVHVEFVHGPARTFGLVVGADGLHSTVRALTFGPERPFLRHMGSHVAVFSAPNILGLEDWQIWRIDEAAGRSMCVYPVPDNSEVRVITGFVSEAPSGDEDTPRDVERQKALIAERTAGLGWEAPKLIEAMWEAPDFYFDAMAQVHMDTWSAGRVTLLGDAGYCASPLSGQGTSLALVGAYVLAAELAAAPGDHEAGVAAYERRMRPFVAANQALATREQRGPAPEEQLEHAKNAIDLGPAGT